jgi:hypothetical protein
MRRINVILRVLVTIALTFGVSKAFAADSHTCVQTSHGCIWINSDVTQNSISTTICVKGYTKSVRPATSYTNGIKKKLMREQGIDLSRIHEFELDHIIPLEVGGHPRNPSNLMLQPWEGEAGAHAKDKLENRLHSYVCKGKVLLEDAQRCIAENWVNCTAKYPGKNRR